MRNKSLRNLLFLLLITLSLYLLDNTRLNKYIGYKKVKEYMSEDINIFGLTKGFLGDKIFNFYNLDASVSNHIIKIEKHQNGSLVYQDSPLLYSVYVGSVIKIDKNNDIYTVVISTNNKNILITCLKSISVRLYQKIEADTLIGYINGEYYYYEEI